MKHAFIVSQNRSHYGGPWMVECICGALDMDAEDNEISLFMRSHLRTRKDDVWTSEDLDRINSRVDAFKALFFGGIQ